jgi:hypothetical protein
MLGRPARITVRRGAMLAVLAVNFVAVNFALLPALAIIGLFFRPGWVRHRRHGSGGVACRHVRYGIWCC